MNGEEMHLNINAIIRATTRARLKPGAVNHNILALSRRHQRVVPLPCRRFRRAAIPFAPAAAVPFASAAAGPFRSSTTEDWRDGRGTYVGGIGVTDRGGGGGSARSRRLAVGASVCW
jgi:hypothetical protein